MMFGYHFVLASSGGIDSNSNDDVGLIKAAAN